MPLENNRLLWSKWVLANGIGILLGTLAATALIPVIALLIAAFGPPDKQPLNIFFLLAIIASAFLGSALGLSQWLVLHGVEQKIRAWAWICATATGALCIWTLILFPEMRNARAPAASFSQGAALTDPQLLAAALFLGASFGAVIGTAQWIVLRRYFERAAWWIVSAALAGTIGLPLLVLALARAEAQTSYWSFWLVGTLGAAAIGVISSSVTGIALVNLRRRA